MTLRAGNSGTNNGSASAGVAQITLDASSSFHQLGFITFLTATQGSVSGSARHDGISLSDSSKWVVYPCVGAGVDLPTTNATNGASLTLSRSSTFKDCRGPSAVRRYPKPVADASSDGSCAPCACANLEQQPCILLPSPSKPPPHHTPSSPASRLQADAHWIVMAAVESLLPLLFVV
jgi:hypothetical protein